MGKVNLYVKTCLINEINEYNIKGILQNNIIKYHDNDAKMIINMKNNTLERIKKKKDIYLILIIIYVLLIVKI